MKQWNLPYRLKQKVRELDDTVKESLRGGRSYAVEAAYIRELLEDARNEILRLKQLEQRWESRANGIPDLTRVNWNG